MNQKKPYKFKCDNDVGGKHDEWINAPDFFGENVKIMSMQYKNKRDQNSSCTRIATIEIGQFNGEHKQSQREREKKN